jgi:AraC family transcriptional activator of pobA
MTQTHLDRERYVLGDPSDHIGFLNCERIVERSHIHGWSVEPHYHEGLAQMFVFGEGHVKGQIDYLSRDIVGPAIVWLPALCSHAFDYQVGMNGWVITIPSIDVMRIAKTNSWSQHWITQPQLVEGSSDRDLLTDIVGLVQQLEKEHKKRGEERNTALESLFMLLLVSLARGLPANPGYNSD